MELPARISKYELQEFLGGGMSHVYRAWDTVIGRTVAVKILTESGCHDPEVKARFLAEARMAGSMAHENVVNIYDFGEDEQHRPYMVMEFLRGEDLRKALRNGHTGDLKTKLQIALQVARALLHIHGLSVVHRDIKPENIYLNAGGTVKLMDFGIAKTEGLALTRAGYVLGTPYYMAPEQVKGESITSQADVYAFGVLLFELLTGTKPIRAETVEQIFYSILNEPLNLEPLQQAGTPRPLCELVARCTAKNAGERPAGFAPIIAALEQAVAGVEPAAQTVVEKAPSAVKAPARQAWMIPGAAVAVLLAGAGLYLALRPRPTSVGAAVKPPDLPRTISTPTGEMVLVPAGEFQFGQNREHASLPAFYVDRTEVTNGAWAAFCQASNRPLPKGFPRDRPAEPVANVTIAEAREFANWAGKRLPNALEWEKAARGVDGRAFPWGNAPDVSKTDVGSGKLRPAGDLGDGASPYGAVQMVGNVWEFIDQVVHPEPETVNGFSAILKPPPRADEPWYMMRGQSSGDQHLDENVIWDYAAFPERWKDPYVGFRCVKDGR